MTKHQDMRVTNDGDPMEKSGWIVFDKDDPMKFVDVLPEFWLAFASVSDRTAISKTSRLTSALLRRTIDAEGLKHQERALLDWLLQALDGIGAGEDPDSAFAWKGGRGRPKTMLDMFEKIKVSVEVGIRKSESPDKSIEDIIGDLSDETGKSEATLWRWYKEVKKGGSIP